MKRGEVWTANLNPNRGTEVGKVRPVLILQDDAVTEAGLHTVAILPLTTQVRSGLSKLRVTLSARDRLRETSQVMIDQPRAIDRGRIGDGPLTVLTPKELASVERGLSASLGMYR